MEEKLKQETKVPAEVKDETLDQVNGGAWGGTITGENVHIGAKYTARITQNVCADE